ncbi:MAG: ribonuclease E/G, partial [Lutibacter sp.]|nr:ribonuclease E/G [Lutibacter sp.]
IVILDKIQEELDKIFIANSSEKVLLNVHPFIAAYLQKGFPSIQHKWFAKYKKWIKILPRDAFQYLTFNFTNKEGEIVG